MSMVNHNHPKVINGQYLLKKRISSGSFGDVYLSQDLRSKEYHAVKIERHQDEEVSSVDREAVFLNHLAGVPSIPKIIWTGKENNTSTMVIQFLGRDLTYYLKQFRKFSIKCILNIADQLLTILENVHKNNILHRDIKPENVLVGRDNETHILYLVDFGISKFYRDRKGAHIPFKEHKPFIGTTRYASIAAHNGHELSRKDDLESLGYMLIYMLKGNLQWQNVVTQSDEEKIKSVGQMKQNLDSTEVCSELPLEFARYLDYVKKLGFSSQPDYKYLQSLFKRVAQTHNLAKGDTNFDWDTPTVNGNQSQRSERQVLQKKSKPSDDPISLLLIRYKKTEIRSSQFMAQSGDQESSMIGGGNSLLKPESRKQSQISLSPNHRHNSRKQSQSSFNDSYGGGSNQYPGGSILVGFQPSMISIRSRNSRNVLPMSQEAILEDNQDDVCSPALKIKDQSPKKHSLSNRPQQMNNKKIQNVSTFLRNIEKKTSVTQLFMQMNDDMDDMMESLEPKYTDLQFRQVKAHFKDTFQMCEKLKKSNT